MLPCHVLTHAAASALAGNGNLAAQQQQQLFGGNAVQPAQQVIQAAQQIAQEQAAQPQPPQKPQQPQQPVKPAKPPQPTKPQQAAGSHGGGASTPAAGASVRQAIVDWALDQPMVKRSRHWKRAVHIMAAAGPVVRTVGDVRGILGPIHQQIRDAGNSHLAVRAQLQGQKGRHADSIDKTRPCECALLLSQDVLCALRRSDPHLLCTCLPPAGHGGGSADRCSLAVSFPCVQLAVDLATVGCFRLSELDGLPASTPVVIGHSEGRSYNVSPEWSLAVASETCMRWADPFFGQDAVCMTGPGRPWALGGRRVGARAWAANVGGPTPGLRRVAGTLQFAGVSGRQLATALRATVSSSCLPYCPSPAVCRHLHGHQARRHLGGQGRPGGRHALLHPILRHLPGGGLRRRAPRV